MPRTDRDSGWRRIVMQVLGTFLLSLLLVLAYSQWSNGSGKLLRPQAFSGKMHGAAVLDPDGQRTINNGSSVGISSPGGRPGGRRILWRQIQ